MGATRPKYASCLGLGICLLLGTTGWLRSALADERTAAKIIEEIHAFDGEETPAAERPNRGAGKDTSSKRLSPLERKSKLVKELFQLDPDPPAPPPLLPERWALLSGSPRTIAEAQAEVTQALARSKNEKILTEASATRVRIAFRRGGSDPKLKEITPLIDEFIEHHPKDERGGEMLAQLARVTRDKAKKAQILERVEKDYPDTMAALKAGKDDHGSETAERRPGDRIGKPFPLAFVEASTGRRITSASLKGKVVVVDFWATWCGPCVAEMPKMKELYAKYKKQGVEFVGVSLDNAPDEGGYEKLMAFVNENQIRWPQFYQGKGWESEFSKSWDIHSIPTVFLVDADGNLASTEARGKLDQMITDLLAKAKKPGAAKP